MSCQCAASAPTGSARLEDPADRGRTDSVTEFQQLTLDPLVPQGVGKVAAGVLGAVSATRRYERVSGRAWPGS